MKKHIVPKKPLVLTRETLRTLSRAELVRVGGGDLDGSGFNCTTFEFNCRPPNPIAK